MTFIRRVLRTGSTARFARHACAGAVALGLLAGSAALAAPANAAPVQPAAAASNVLNDSNRLQVQQVFDGINNFRRSKGLKPVKFYVNAAKVAQDWSTRMANTGVFEHNPYYAKDARVSGWSTAGEIIAARSDRVGQGLVDQWIKSKDHNDIMSDPDYTVVGVGIAFSDEAGGRFEMYGTANFFDYNPDRTTGVYTSPNAYYATPEPAVQSLSQCTSVAGSPAAARDLSQASIKSPADYIAADSAGKLWRYPEKDNRTLGKRVLIGSSGWQHARSTSVADWNNDGYLDIVAHWSDGKIRVYKGRATGGFSPWFSAGSIATTSTVIADRLCSNNPFPGLIVKDASGNLSLYQNLKGAAFHAAGNKFNTGWGNYTIAITDFDQDGRKDLLGAHKTTGVLKLYRTNGKGALVSEARKTVGSSGWSTAATFTDATGFGTGSANGMIVKFRNGTVRYYELPADRVAASKQIGYGFSTYNPFS
ncbi:Allergen V5/Tpx-1 family protein [Arthrobacter crystallopoietes BAB-32]|uniref:Allergen V5/Tpx-1 family protein n=1 Tax=Arthrobacter crystallopoietes BAB-32 TaxID=1246476 RepID=N1UWG3_9MICC|nr:CAP domain-containing protein [Arthrobacter crystallopoietes]EMY33400.1 Allergen V5/Tpx-1 family protein [Arthrobacter crystallopoietes BAB-32]